MPRRRFIAPTREQVDRKRFDMPPFASFDSKNFWFTDDAWPNVEVLTNALDGKMHPVSGARLAFVEQTSTLLQDGLHYEERIFERGQIATRPQNWHDLFNAVVWLRFMELKTSLNTAQMQDIVRVGGKIRTRRQSALTQFDEAGVIVTLRDSNLLPLWDAHDWRGLFFREAQAWRDGRIHAEIFGHALLEHALWPDIFLVGKAAVIVGDTKQPSQILAEAIVNGHALNDPQTLRPLPLSGIPGWHPQTETASFYLKAPCFQPLRAGRQYPPAIRWPSA
ncbi:DUF3025 domain-containing protein [Gammaproteobacteria bacterium]